MTTVSVRYIVDDVETAIGFYRDRLGFDLLMHPAPPFAVVAHGDLRLLLSAPGGPGGGGQALADGSRPEPGGWNRIALEVDDVRGEIERLRAAGVAFRSELIEGVGGDQVLVQDPAGNLVELFQAKPRG